MNTDSKPKTRLVKRILIGVFVALSLVITVPLIAALFFPTKIVVEREITINRPKEEVFHFIKQIKNQKLYNKWMMMDPKIKQAFRGQDGTVGFIASWDSENENVGKGEQEIKKIVEGERLDIELRFEHPFRGTSPIYTLTERISPSQTRVESGFQGEMSYPMNLICSFIAEKLGQDMQDNLIKLKGVLEARNSL